MKLETVLSRIQTIADNHRLKYQLETKFKIGTGSRVIISYIAPDNILNYAIYKTANIPELSESYTEEEVLITITKVGDKWKDDWKWRIGKQTDKSPINFIRPEIENALITTDWIHAHRQLAGENERKIEVVKYHNRGWGHEYIAKKTGYVKTSVDNIVSEMRAKYPAYVKGARQSKKKQPKK